MNQRDTTYTDEELGYPPESHGCIPSFANRDEEAAFRDTHDFTEFVGVELQPVEIVVKGDLARSA